MPRYPSNVREPVITTTSLGGSLLIAHPSLTDPNFHKTVLVLPDHSPKDGSFGLVINRPTGKVIGDLLQGDPLGKLARIPVLHGGPVQTDQLLLVAFRWHPQTNTLECRHHISIEEAAELSTAQYHTVRGFVGYSGWGGGQLENELAQRSWLVRKSDVEDLLELEKANQLWRELTSGFGPWLRLAAEAPDDPSVN